MASINDYPAIIVQEIAKRLDYRSIQAMKLCNRHIYNALTDSLLWIELCERDKRALPSIEFRKSLAESADNNEACVGQLDFERIWVKNPFRSNLAPPMLESLADMQTQYGWTFNRSEDAEMMVVEEPPAGTEPHPEVTRCIATSCWEGKRIVKIDLVKEGIPEWILDHIRPRIIVGEMVAPRWDCGSTYTMRTKLLRPDEEFGRIYEDDRIMNTTKAWNQWTSPCRWEKVEMTFEDYPMGIRHIEVHSCGEDRQNWAGNYGAKFANLEIRIEMPDKVYWITGDDE
ncbi:hypothetical protein PRIPAC_86202 [Pristionchus pacificus]|uniref:Uncharacterized protein n=1 Tax=Pristionchus pacificus TaxID=54126 RepID=A0A2A6BU07_PRIPA|nr:hypothetical protein PRIPAC_86202 [Pristionchus pacificus]|eukprot:PDM69385.1 hypothetical protein PRIPAC_47687 [Pristionchus pacificus]